MSAPLTTTLPRRLLISNFILFQVGWFACVLGGAHDMATWGSLIALGVVAIHLWQAPDRRLEIRLLGIALLIGLIFESVMVLTQLADYHSGIFMPGLAPHWMVMLWVLFATTLNVSMCWIKALHPGWIALLGAVLTPLSYFAGYRLGAVTYSDVTLSLIAIAIAWAILLPVLVIAARQFPGYTPAPHTETSGRHSHV